MVLTNQEYGLANTKRQFDPKLEALFQLRGATKSYIVQCVTDREIQKMLASEHPSKAYTFNCYVVHSPVKYCRATAINGPGWDSKTSKPCFTRSEKCITK